MTRWLAALSVTFAAALAAPAQLPPEKALATMKPADGFQVELFAAEPLLLNPTSIDVDHRGRVWVAEAVNYRRVGFNRPLIRPEGDRIVVLVDKNNDGKADESVVFYQGKDLYGPIGVCVAAQPDGKALKVFVCQSPDILVFDDADGDLKADGPPKKFLTGFGGFDHDHGVHGINIGPDGKLYFTVGDAGVTALQGTDKKGPVWKSNTTTVQKGTVWRCDMDGGNLELIAHNFRNNYECCVDSFGEIWLSDNDDDGNQQTRICFVMPGGNYGYGPRGAGESHWHEEQPGVVHKTLRTGFGSPTGITFYEGALFPEKYRGALLHCDAGPREVRAFFRKPKGAGYELDKEVILTSSDNWFRPSDVCVAPDGSIFVADWYDRGVGGHGMGDPTDGRIYRLTPKGHKGYAVPPVKLDTPEGVLAALGSPCQATRAAAIAVIRKMSGDEVNKTLFAVGVMGDLKNGKTIPTERLARTAWMLAEAYDKKVTWDRNPQNAMAYIGLYDVLGERNRPGAGALYLRILPSLTKRGYMPALLGPKVDTLPDLLDHFASTEAEADPKMMDLVPSRREMLLILQNVEAAKAKATFYKLAKFYDGKDIFYRAALNIACGTDPARRDAILADFDKHFPEWNDTVADLVWELRPKSVLPRLGKLLTDAKLTGPQKARVVDILAAADDPAAGQTMLGVLASDAPAEVKARALDQLRLFLPTKWKGLRQGPELATVIDHLLADRTTAQTGLRLVAAAGAVNRVEAVANIATDGKSPKATREEAARTLGTLRTAVSVDTLKMVATTPTVDPDTYQVEAVNALAALAGGPGKDDVGPKAQAVLQGIVLDTGGSSKLKSATVEALAGTRPGTAWLLDLHAKGKLPKELVAQAGRLLRNSPFQGERNRALLLFPAPGKLNPKNLPALAELARRTGDPARGKQVWDASLAGAAQCAKCHTVRGVGGQVGPDLSMIGKKGGKENLLESILVPSKAVADQYVQVSVTTAADLTVSGLVVADTPQAITLRDANGKDTAIPKADVVAQKKLMLSIMPEDIVAGLTEDELTDLVAYLTTLQTAALTPAEFKIAGPFKASNMLEALGKEFGPEKGTAGVEWKAIRPDAKGYFDLAAFHGDAGNNSASYMAVEVESPADQEAEVLLGPDDGAKLWVNGAEVFKTEATRAAAPGQEKVGVKLKKGTNAILLKVANGNNPHGFYFTLLSKDEVKTK